MRRLASVASAACSLRRDSSASCSSWGFESSSRMVSGVTVVPAARSIRSTRASEGADNPAQILRHERPEPAHLPHHRPVLHGVRPQRGCLHGRSRRLQPRAHQRAPPPTMRRSPQCRQPSETVRTRSAWARDVHGEPSPIPPCEARARSPRPAGSSSRARSRAAAGPRASGCRTWRRDPSRSPSTRP